MKSPKSLLGCGDSNRPRVPGVLRFSGYPFVPPSLARAGRLIGSRVRHRRDRTAAIGRISLLYLVEQRLAQIVLLEQVTAVAPATAVGRVLAGVDAVARTRS